MKNIFFVINKEKLYAYVVSILTIVTLFFMSHVLNSDLSATQETASNIQQNTIIENGSLVSNNEITETNSQK